MNSVGRYQRHPKTFIINCTFNFTINYTHRNNFSIGGINHRIKKLGAFNNKPSFTGLI